MTTVTGINFLCNCAYGHALSCTELAFRHATETHLEFEVANKDEEKKAGYLQSVALDFKLLGVGPELGTFGSRVQRSGHSTTPPRDATSHVLFLNQSVLVDFDDRKKRDSHCKTRSLSGTSNDATKDSLVLRSGIIFFIPRWSRLRCCFTLESDREACSNQPYNRNKCSYTSTSSWSCFCGRVCIFARTECDHRCTCRNTPDYLLRERRPSGRTACRPQTTSSAKKMGDGQALHIFSKVTFYFGLHLMKQRGNWWTHWWGLHVHVASSPWQHCCMALYTQGINWNYVTFGLVLFLNNRDKIFVFDNLHHGKLSSWYCKWCDRIPSYRNGITNCDLGTVVHQYKNQSNGLCLRVPVHKSWQKRAKNRMQRASAHQWRQ